MVVLLSKFPSFYGIWRFMLTRTFHLSLFWARWNQFTPWYRACCNISVNTHITFHSKVTSSRLIVAILLCRFLSKWWGIIALHQFWILLVVRWSGVDVGRFVKKLFWVFLEPMSRQSIGWNEDTRHKRWLVMSWRKSKLKSLECHPDAMPLEVTSRL